MVPDDAAHGGAPSSATQLEQPAVIPFVPAAGTWTLAWVVGSIVFAPLLITAMGVDSGSDLTIEQLLLVAAVAWIVLLVALVLASRRFGTGDVVADYAVRFRPVDLVGVPVGVVTQLALIPLLYAPLRALWPDTFSTEKLEERAQDLADRATGLSTVLLVVIVVVGAPIVEELVYRGLLQRSMATAVGATPALVFTSVWFSLIHFSPIEYPGLFLAGLVFGAGVVITKRIGPAIVTHAAFNATGIIMVLSDR